MTDRKCVELLQWALPKLQFRWPGFRKVRRIVCKRLAWKSLAAVFVYFDNDEAGYAVRNAATLRGLVQNGEDGTRDGVFLTRNPQVR